jgi:hypothetical protein
VTDSGSELDRPDPTGDYLDLAALLSSPLPLLGGALQQLFSGHAQDRRLRRIRDVLIAVDDKVRRLGAAIREEYIRSDEFQDLLDHTLRQVQLERHEEKRRLYREFLVSVISSPGDYEEQLRVLRTLEQLQLAHIALIRAILQEPDPRYVDGISGSFDATLKRRMPTFSQEQIGDLVGQLNDLRITQLNLGGMMTARGAEDLRHGVRPFGQRFVEYILAADHEEQAGG